MDTQNIEKTGSAARLKRQEKKAGFLAKLRLVGLAFKNTKRGKAGGLGILLRRGSSIIKSPRFPLRYAIFSVIVLVATTLVWAILGASLQSTNADQLINSYLFNSPSVFHQAVFPASHSQLIKWPLFYLINLFGATAVTIAIFTVAITLITVGILALLLYRIERRPLVFGTLILALASTLLLVPAQPYAGAILPVNMAMLATRNLEYVLYITSLVLFFRTSSLRSPRFWLAVGLMSLLIASDKLFLALGLGGALLALIFYALSGGWKLVSLSSRWLVGTIVGGGLAIILLRVINSSGLTHISSKAVTGPYTLITTVHNAILGLIYGVGALFTNFGANPAYDATILRNIPHTAASRLFGIGGPAFLVNIVILVAGAWATWTVVSRSWKHHKKNAEDLDSASKLSIMLAWSSLAALILFVASDHYYAVDARYLTIALFGAFISLATFSRGRTWSAIKLLLVGVALSFGLIFAVLGCISSYHAQEKAQATIRARNSLVAGILLRHHVDVLVGDYWRVIPTKEASSNKLNVLPLASCQSPRDILSSSHWQLNLEKHSFAYLLSLDQSATDYPSCTLDQVTKAYGRPNTSVIVAGSQDRPKEVLLFYDSGANNSSPKITLKTPSTILPIPLSDLPYTACPSGRPIMNIVAHQDDDLLFMNPDTLSDIKAGNCIRTVYVTAGDAGSGQFYYLSREQGSEAAYSEMLGSKELWVQRIVQLPDHEYVMVAHPRSNYQVSLIFMRLPDGNLRGQGFSWTNYQSLARLSSGLISSIESVDDQSSYSSSQLVSSLSSLMHVFQVGEVRTQANFVSETYPDHSDHMTVGSFTKKAFTQYLNQQFEGQPLATLKFYIGYPIRSMPANVSGQLLAEKEAAWFAYAQFEKGQCSTDAACAKLGTYGSYLRRQYQNSY